MTRRRQSRGNRAKHRAGEVDARAAAAGAASAGNDVEQQGDVNDQGREGDAPDADG